MYFYVGDNPIEYVDSFVHLEHVITNILADNDDNLRRRNEFIGYLQTVPIILHESIWL